MTKGEINQELIESLIDVEELYQNAPCGYFSFLPDGTVIKMNRTLLKWLGFQEAEVLFEKKLASFLNKGGLICYEMVHLPMLKMQSSVNEINYDLIRKDGSAFPALLNSSTVRDELGNLRAINTTVYNITDRKKYEKDLLQAKRQAEAEKERFEFLADLVPEIIWTAESTGEIDYVNQRFFRYFNLSQKPLNRETIICRIHPADRKRCFRAWIRALREGKDFETQVRLENQYQIYEWHMIRSVPHRDRDEQITKWFGSCSNINEHVTALQRKDEFINIASHELKTPITSLKAYNQLLMRSDVNDKVKAFVARSASTLTNLEFLVSSLLDVSQINAGYFSLNIGTVSLNEIIKHSIDLVSFSYPSHRILAEYDLKEEIIVKADEMRITQVVINLLTNAIKYSPGADKVILRVEKNTNERVVKIEVEDFGLGIPEEKIDRIFEKYYRVTDSKDNNKVAGLGLGLYIIQNIVKMHGSTIFLNSTVHKGSTFYFSLPIETLQHNQNEIFS